MKWTANKPTVKGWYWYAGPSSGLDIVRVYEGVDGLKCRTSCSRWNLDELDGRWAGPIKRPKAKLPWED